VKSKLLYAQVSIYVHYQPIARNLNGVNLEPVERYLVSRGYGRSRKCLPQQVGRICFQARRNLPAEKRIEDEVELLLVRYLVQPSIAKSDGLPSAAGASDTSAGAEIDNPMQEPFSGFPRRECVLTLTTILSCTNVNCGFSA